MKNEKKISFMKNIKKPCSYCIFLLLFLFAIGLAFFDLAKIKNLEEKIEDLYSLKFETVNREDTSEKEKEQEFGKCENFDEEGKDIFSEYPWHKNITVTFFWAGEEAGKDNRNISNLESAWNNDWVNQFGGIDDPENRKEFFPADFMPKENPFYFALPYNDFDGDGKRKKEVFDLAQWSNEREWSDNESVLKNQWIEINRCGKRAYAQWQDVGPFGENDKDYVFGDSDPKNSVNKRAGLDVSPAVRDYLNLSDIDLADWRFIREMDVPDGPWKNIITKSQVYWK